MRTALLAALCAGCLGTPEDAEWVSWDSIEGALRPEVASSPPVEPPTPGNAIRIATYNVHLGRDVEALAAAFTDVPELAAADLLFVQEIEDHPAEGGSRASRLAEALGMAFAYAPARTVGDDATHGLAILSRYPLERIEVMALPDFEFPIRDRRRIALAADVVFPSGQRLRAIDVHLDTRLNITQRVQQLYPATELGSEPIALGGDFNTNPYVWVDGTVPLAPINTVSDLDQARLLDDFMIELGYAAPTADSGPTHRAGPIELRLDSIYVRDLQPRAFGVARGVDLSDHKPLWLELSADFAGPATGSSTVNVEP